MVKLYLFFEYDKTRRVLDAEDLTEKPEPVSLTFALLVAFAFPVFGKILRGFFHFSCFFGDGHNSAPIGRFYIFFYFTIKQVYLTT